MLEAELRRSWRTKVIIGCGALAELPEVLNELSPPNTLIVADASLKHTWLPRVAALAREAGTRVKEITVGEGEGVKDVETLVTLWRAMTNAELTRKSVVVAVGGGAVLDVAGFAAATYMRGCGLVNIPSTLLAQADAAVGGKTGVNVAGKNTVGAFHHADAVIIDPSLLSTLPDNAFRAGLAEVIKHAVIEGEAGVRRLESRLASVLRRDPKALEEVIAGSVALKLRVVERDYVESGVRAVLNFGHTVGHALERATNYGLSHGESVAVGLRVESLMATNLLGFPEAEASRITLLLRRSGLPVRVPGVSAEEVVSAARLDKKFVDGEPRLPLPRRLGDFEIVTLDWEGFGKCLRNALRRCA